jgi:geranylgeranyl diphosphate synthase type II
MQRFQDLLPKFETLFVQHEFPSSPKSLYEPCSYLLHLGGKRVRPVLCLMAHELFAEINDNAYNTAIAIELFHNFTLMHDDIMDQAPLRRGQPTVHTKYNVPTAILSGDVMSIYSYVHLNKIETQYIHVVLELFNKTAIQICEGQQLDMDYEHREVVTTEEYFHMITLKTSVLLGMSVQLGAILGGASDGCSKQLFEYGKNVGLAFQLKDDYLDTFGEVAKIGKQIGGDIRSNKKTYLLAKAHEVANAQQRLQLSELILRNDDNKFSDMITLFETLAIKEKLEEEIKCYTDKAFQLLEDAPILSKRKSALIELTTDLLLRTN